MQNTRLLVEIVFFGILYMFSCQKRLQKHTKMSKNTLIGVYQRLGATPKCCWTPKHPLTPGENIFFFHSKNLTETSNIVFIPCVLSCNILDSVKSANSHIRLSKSNDLDITKFQLKNLTLSKIEEEQL